MRMSICRYYVCNNNFVEKKRIFIGVYFREILFFQWERRYSPAVVVDGVTDVPYRSVPPSTSLNVFHSFVGEKADVL